MDVGENSGSSAISINSTSKTIKVETIDISAIFRSFDLKKKIFIKMDIEGSENLVIEEFIDFYKNNFDFICMFENNLSLENVKKLEEFIENKNLFVYFLKQKTECIHSIDFWAYPTLSR